MRRHDRGRNGTETKAVFEENTNLRAFCWLYLYRDHDHITFDSKVAIVTSNNLH